jgi:hydrogenase maturation protease
MLKFTLFQQSRRLFSPNTGKEAGSSPRTLLLGYGNIDRQDDGVAWHILKAIASQYGLKLPDFPEETHYDLSPWTSFHFELQLAPEIAELVSTYQRVAFIDAHTGRVEQPFHHETLNPEFVTSPFTHHLTPSTCLSLAQTIYGSTPQAVLVSVRGYEFGFSRTLSATTFEYVRTAATWLTEWMKNPS